MTDLWYGTSGPPDAKIVLVAESWGAEEKAQKKPLVGQSGRIMDGILAECGIDRKDVLCTNLIAEKPDGNDTYKFFLPKGTNPHARRVGGLIPSSFVDGEVRRLYMQLAHSPRSVVIAAGNWSLWGLSRCTRAEILRQSNGRKIPADQQTYAPGGIMDWRGSMWHLTPHPEYEHNVNLNGTQLLPIIHPAAVMRSWDLRSPTVHDLRVRVPMALRNNWRPSPSPTLLSPPTFREVVETLTLWLERARTQDVPLACDVETLKKRYISCIGFADSPRFAISIPFIASEDADGGLYSYWSVDEEAQILALLRRVLTHPRIKIIGQNFIYDTQYIQHWWGVVPNLWHDTMLAQNVIFPGTPKDLAYLSSLYCDYHWYWKEDGKDWNTLGDIKKLLDYNCLDNLRTFEVAINQIEYIKSVGQEEQMKFKMDTSRLCLRMMNRGVRFDSSRAGSMYFELDAVRTAFYQELLGIIPQEWVKPLKKKTDKPWYRSPQQTATVFYDILGFKPVLHPKTDRPTVGKPALAILERRHPEFTALFRRLDYAGSVDNTMGVIQTPVEHDGRMRCSYNPGGTETHRLSSSENVFGRGTNFQNLTKGEEDD